MKTGGNLGPSPNSGGVVRITNMRVCEIFVLSPCDNVGEGIMFSVCTFAAFVRLFIQTDFVAMRDIS